MSKKPKAIFLWDIDPDKWYLRVRSDRACVGDLVKIHCDKKTTGWQRGHVIMSTPSWERPLYIAPQFMACMDSLRQDKPRRITGFTFRIIVIRLCSMSPRDSLKKP